MIDQIRSNNKNCDGHGDGNNNRKDEERNESMNLNCTTDLANKKKLTKFDIVMNKKFSEFSLILLFVANNCWLLL